jgi:tetratricopeptide (TPR) repeat protein
MSQPVGPNQGKSLSPDMETDECVLRDLMGWGELLSTLVQVLDPFYQLEDLLQTEHPLTDSDKPLGAIVRHFGKGSAGEEFLIWWIGCDDSLPHFNNLERLVELIPLCLSHRWRASELQSSALKSFEKFDKEWSIGVDRLSQNGGTEAMFSKPLGEVEWLQVQRRLCARAPANLKESGPRLTEAIDRVRSFFAPLESPLFGMDDDLLAHHVQETIPLERPSEELTPIVPLFGKGHLQKAFPSTAQLPAHLRVILHRLVRSQDAGDMVTSLLATLEAVDFSIRFATGVGQGVLAVILESDFAGHFNPTTQEIVKDLDEVLNLLPQYWDDPRSHAATHLLFQGRLLHPFLKWGGVGTDQRLLGWMKEAEETIRQDDPARAASLLSEVMELFNGWVSEVTLLCSSWDLVTHVRQDGYLQISLGRGEVWFSCKPLIDPTRYSVWLDRSELTLVNKGGSLRELKDGMDPVEALDPRISIHDEDPPFLQEQLGALIRAHEQGQVLPLGRSLFFGLEYLVRLHASLAGGFLRHCFDETSLLDPVAEPGGSLEHIIFFLSYSERVLGRTKSADAQLLRDVFFSGDRPREFTRWLGVDGGVPGPLQGLLGWSLSLMRPDAKTRLDEIRGQVERLSGLFADLLDTSRSLFKTANLQTDVTGEGTEAVVMRFPSGLRIRGVPDVVNGPRLEAGRRNVVVITDEGEYEHFSDWEGEDFQFATLDPEESTEEEEPSWPSFFDEGDSDIEPWDTQKSDAISRICQSRSFAGPDARPRQVAEEIAAVVSRGSREAASVLFCEGSPGTGKTNLCRTLTNPACTPLPEDYPVLYLRVDRFPQTRLATVVERLNDHIASEQSMERFQWDSVPLESLKALGGEVARLSSELAGLGVTSESLANRLASYLRQLQTLNGDRNFLLILDGFGEVPKSIIPSTLPPGVHLLITGTSFPEREWSAHHYLEIRKWELNSEAGEETFARQLQGLHLDEAERHNAWQRFQGSLFLGRVFGDLRALDESVPPNTDVLHQIFATARAKFPEQNKFITFLRLLAVLGLYERPVPLSILQTRVADAQVVLKAVELFPSLFAFWDAPKPTLALGHRSVLEWVRQNSLEVEWVAHDLSESFLDHPKRGDLMSALRWFGLSDHTPALMERFFSEKAPLKLWREELARLQKRGLFFQRVALLDAISEPLGMAVVQASGHLREELAWVYNARGLSLLELGLVGEAERDFEQAIQLFSELFEQGDLGVLEALASAHSRRSEAALRNSDIETALSASVIALELIGERLMSHEPDPGLSELHSRVLLQSARSHLAEEDYEGVLTQLSSALTWLDEIKPQRARSLRGECFLVAARALRAQGLDSESIEQLDTAVDMLMAGPTAELGLEALILRGRLYQKLGSDDEADRDLQRALSILRYHVAVGRLDLEPMLAYTAAQASLVGDRSTGGHGLSEYIAWAGNRIRYEGRTDLRGLLAFLLLTRGARWKELGHFTEAASDLRRATEQYDLLCHELSEDEDQSVWSTLRQSFKNLTALYLSLDEPHLALICGRRALELGRRQDQMDSSEEERILPLDSLAEPGPTEAHLSEIKLFQMGKLYFHLGEAARRVGLRDDGNTYFERAARAFSQACGNFDEVPEGLLIEYALVLKSAAQAAFQDNDPEELEKWVEEMADLPPAHLTDFDVYRFKRWAGQTAQATGNLEEGQRFFEDALEVVAHLKDHPRWRSLEAEILLDLGRVLSLQECHDEALSHLDKAARKAHDSVFAESEENRDLLVLCALHSAVAHLRAGRSTLALEQLRILVSMRPGPEIPEVKALAQDWVNAWKASDTPIGMELLKSLGRLSELGDWLLRTALGGWYRTLAVALIEDSQFEHMVMSSSRIDRILETYLILTFSQVDRDTRPDSNPELEKLLAAKFRAFDAENRDLEAELLMGHLLPIRLNPESAKLLLRRSEMALMRGDRGLAIIDLLRAIDGGGDTRLRAHLRLAEFLQSRSLHAGAVHHLRSAMQATDGRTEGLSSLCGRCCRLLTRLAKEGVMLDLGFYREHFRLLTMLDRDHLKPVLDLVWLRPARDQKEWPELLGLTIEVLSKWQEVCHDKPSDWAFLEELLDRTVLCQGQLSLDTLEQLGRLLTQALSTYDVQSRGRASSLWERFANFLPGLGKRTALDLLQRLFDFALRTDPASAEGQAQDFLRRLEEEKRILVQPR